MGGETEVHYNRKDFFKILTHFFVFAKNHIRTTHRYKKVTKKLKILRNHIEKIPWLIVSGGDQKELIEVFKHKQIYDLFNGGIFGSPDKKNEIIQREIINGKIDNECLEIAKNLIKRGLN